jgi:methanogenic corrinoid protein MtbC1
MARRNQDDGSDGPPPVPEGEAITRLARRALERIAAGVVDAPVSAAYVETFCTCLRSGDKVAADRMLRAAAQSRPGYARIADGLLTAAARRLGEMWERDEASFLEVSMAISVIFRLNRDHAQKNVPIERDPALRQAVFATMPGQSHNLGLVLAAEAFRDADWQVTLLLDASAELILDRVRRLRPEIVGLSVSGHVRSHLLAGLIQDLGSMPSGVRILLGGSAAEEVFARLPSRRGVEIVRDIQSVLDKL